MRVTLVQTDLVWENPSANRDHIGHLLAQHVQGSGTTDVVVLPEMFTTGFTMHPSDCFELPEGPTQAWMLALAQKFDAAVTGSVVIKDGEQFFNRLLWVQPDGTVHRYDKRHLFSLAGEHEHYTAGHQRLTIDWRGWRIRPQICYDLRFPVWSRNDDDYDALMYVANWPERRIGMWDALLTARAIENQAYVVAVNRIGTDNGGLYHPGHSCVIDFGGQTLTKTAHQTQVSTIELDKAKISTWRQQLPFLADRDRFTVL